MITNLMNIGSGFVHLVTVQPWHVVHGIRIQGDDNGVA